MNLRGRAANASAERSRSIAVRLAPKQQAEKLDVGETLAQAALPHHHQLQGRDHIKSLLPGTAGRDEIGGDPVGVRDISPLPREDWNRSAKLSTHRLFEPPRQTVRRIQIRSPEALRQQTLINLLTRERHQPQKPSRSFNDP